MVRTLPGALHAPPGALLSLLLLLAPAAVRAQGTLADYERAARLATEVGGLSVNVAQPPTWIDGTDRFYYRRTVSGGAEWVTVEATTQAKRPAFDHARLAAALSEAARDSFTALTLPFNAFEFRDGERTLEATFAQSRWRCDLGAYACERTGAAGPGAAQRSGEVESDVRPSPDGRWEALIRNFNVAVREAGSNDVRILSHDGSEGDPYILASIRWAPDSRKLAAYRVRPGYRRMVPYIESSPSDQLQPKLSENFYRKPGDVLDRQQPVLFHVEDGRQLVVDNELFPNAYNLTNIAWRDDARAFTFEYNERGHRIYRVIEVDATNGRARAVISEEPETFFYYRDTGGGQTSAGSRYRYDIDDGREVIWMSERDGWAHLYLYDGATGRVKNRVTRGDWVVRGVDSVDVASRRLWFRASGMRGDQDPYFVHYYRINFDGSGLVAYTNENANHTLAFSPDRQWYTLHRSRVDLPPVLELRRASDRSLVAEIERGDMSAQLAAGWRPPEIFVAKGRDGRTDIWGVIVRPTNFDSTRSHPVIEQIYAGPQGSFVPKSFASWSALYSLAELGFIVVQIDGMGTANRGKAFHDVAWNNLGDAGFPDRKLWHQAVAAKYPYYDLSRVGIYGGSAGGQNAMGALLFHPEFYHVAFSSVGCHDNRMDKIWWNELWMGWPLAPHYEASSNVVNAHRLEGRLMLVVGELDTNVDPASTMQVVNALIRAGKDFELIVFPGGGHGAGGDYGMRRRNDFFVRHLLGVEPPERNRTGAAANGAGAAGNGGAGGDSPLHPAALSNGMAFDLNPDPEAYGFFESPDAPGWGDERRIGGPAFTSRAKSR